MIDRALLARVKLVNQLPLYRIAARFLDEPPLATERAVLTLMRWGLENGVTVQPLAPGYPDQDSLMAQITAMTRWQPRNAVCFLTNPESQRTWCCTRRNWTHRRTRWKRPACCWRTCTTRWWRTPRKFRRLGRGDRHGQGRGSADRRDFRALHAAAPGHPRRQTPPRQASAVCRDGRFARLSHKF